MKIGDVMVALKLQKIWALLEELVGYQHIVYIPVLDDNKVFFPQLLSLSHGFNNQFFSPRFIIICQEFEVVEGDVLLGKPTKSCLCILAAPSYMLLCAPFV